ncbi:reverse transcriptase [Plasmopara halstedii]|uniref:Reverse transcriptase n=1 Tax=Plasmopara halstedii TaxID=4781 RepID=A0A0P1AKD6_PLAHL|nr:reverse transcriptase [Plasmopara halstedii]CEG41492.1 reverse transcriptase [Plasmopara halstedii]|eukprot:XP_024577861.1 reverse transcriptase [Plasmopara halstedii]
MTGEEDGGITFEAIPAVDTLLELEEMSFEEFDGALKTGSLAEMVIIRSEEEIDSLSLLDEAVLEYTKGPDYELANVTTVTSSVTDLISAAYVGDDMCVALLQALGSKEIGNSDNTGFGCNTGVVVFVGRLNKMAHLAAVSDTINGVGTATLLVDRVFRQHGLSGVLGTKIDMSTTDHPQTDGQTERVNRVAEDVLRSDETPKRWSAMLPLEKFALTNAVHFIYRLYAVLRERAY